MLSNNKFFSAAAFSMLLMAGAGVQAATVYCPNGPGGALTAPTSGRYVEVTNAANPGVCQYKDGNLQNADITAAGFTLVDKNGSEGSEPGLFLSSGFPGGSTSGTWAFDLTVDPNPWASYDHLYLAFHFGNGGGSPDSFVVELQNGQTSGDWKFLAVDPQKVNGLSNYYLLATTGDVPPDEIPEPAPIALMGLALAGIALARRRGKAKQAA